MAFFFQPNLTNGVFKEREEDTLLIQHDFVERKYDHNKKRFPKFGMATYTKDIVLLT